MAGTITTNVITNFLTKVNTAGLKKLADGLQITQARLKSSLAAQEKLTEARNKASGAVAEAAKVVPAGEEKEFGKSILGAQKQAQADKVVASQRAEMARVMKATGLTANQSAKAISQLGFKFNKAGVAVDVMGKKMKLTNKIMTDMKKTTRRFEMGFLSMMFAAMALNRVLGTFLRGAVTAYNKAAGETNNFRKETNKLTASWEFFKFSMIDALSKSSILQSVVRWVVNLVNWFNALTPATKAWIAASIGMLFVLTLLMMIVGQIGLAKGGFEVLGDMSRKTFEKMGGSLWKVLVNFILWAVIILFLWQVGKGFFKFFNSEMKNTASSTEDETASMAKAFMKNFVTIFKFLGIAVGEFLIMMILNIIDFGIAMWRAFNGISTTVRGLFGIMWLLILKGASIAINAFISILESAINKGRKFIGKSPISFGKFDTKGYDESIRKIKQSIVDLPNPEDKMKDISGRTMRWVNLIGSGVTETNKQLIDLNRLSKTGDVQSLTGQDLSKEPGVTSGGGNVIIDNSTTVESIILELSNSVDTDAMRAQAQEAAQIVREEFETELNASLGSNNT